MFLVPLALHALRLWRMIFRHSTRQPVRQSVQITTDDGSGSGFLIYHQFGHIATNYHVIRNSRYIAVQFHDGRKVKGEVIATNDKYDLALIKVNSSVVHSLTPLQIVARKKKIPV